MSSPDHGGWFAQKRTIYFESHDHTKIGAAKISKPNFQRLFQATQKRTSAERSQKATTVKKFSAKKVSVKKEMFKTVYKLNKNVVNLTNQGEVGKDPKKLEFN